MEVEDILKERNKTHGNYPEQAATAQEIKILMRSTPNWQNLSTAKKESLEHIATKISRILHGDPNHADSWDDISGYSTLARQEGVPSD